MKQYKPLYLKYRPQKLSELIGQEVVTKTLSNAILYNKIVHAYLFCGPRGTGKTSAARILAKSLNCEKGTTVAPCGECVHCRSITEGNSLDVIEIDAASHRKVEDAEDLINRVNLGTYGSRFKIYIIDEVHMLTDHAFNALLKTLEEPPKNVIFILATTEEYKVLPTIISRCQKLDFKSILQNDLENGISQIASSEKINIDKNILGFISKKAYGCLRDAVSLLDQISVLQTDDKLINPKEVFELFGTVDRKQLFKLLISALNFDRKTAIDLAESFIKSGKDINELFKSLLQIVIDIAKAKIDLSYRKILQDELGEDLSWLETIKQNHLLKIIDRLQDSQAKLRFALSQELQFMVDIMSILDEDFLVSLSDLKERISNLERGKQGIKEAEARDQQPKVPTPIHTELDENLELKDQNLELQIPTSNLKTQSSTNGDLDSLWVKIVSLIDSNPTKTLLTQSESYLLTLTNDLIEVALSKDIFLPRLEKDVKKKEMILKAVKLASNIEPQTLKFRILSRETSKVHKSVISEIEKAPNDIEKIPLRSNDDDFTKTVKDLLGAKEIN